MDRGAWQATVHGVTKSCTQLSDQTTAAIERRCTSYTDLILYPGLSFRALGLCAAIFGTFLFAWMQSLPPTNERALLAQMVVSCRFSDESSLEAPSTKRGYFTLYILCDWSLSYAMMGQSTGMKAQTPSQLATTLKGPPSSELPMASAETYGRTALASQVNTCRPTPALLTAPRCCCCENSPISFLHLNHYQNLFIEKGPPQLVHCLILASSSLSII